MRLLIIMTLLTAVSSPLRVRPFEAIIGSFLLVPLLLVLFHSFLPFSPMGCYIALLAVMAIWCFIHRNEIPEEKSYLTELIPLGVFFVAFLSFHWLCLEWPDFISIGERLRDYALLGSVLRSPVILQEPWMSGSSLNYYAYWYRFGAFLSSIANLKPWEVYHQLQAFTFALFFTAIFRIGTRFFSYSAVFSLFLGVITVLGSNLEGVFSFLQKENGWWGPSRVIPGSIHEFPVWSFLLGDLHPHYLNLAAIPLAILLLMHFMQRSQTWLHRIVVAFAFGIIPSGWIYISNAWEVPIWGSFVLVLLALLTAAYYSQWREFPGAFRREMVLSLKSPWRTIFGSFVIVLITSALYISSLNIEPADYPWSAVSGDVARTRLLDFSRHWAIPLVAAGAALLSSAHPYVFVGAAVFAGLSFMNSPEALPFLWLLVFLNAVRIGRMIREKQTVFDVPRLVSESLLFVGLITVMVPEYRFLDDPYGGEIERMNTIFKFYSSGWFFIQLGSFGILRSTLLQRGKLPIEISASAMALVCVVMCAFFIRTIPMRRSGESISPPREEGLSQVERDFPGSAAAIRWLRDKPDTVILEAQGNPYSYTTFVSTLAGKDAFLGWANHVNLITRNYGEVSRRERVSEEFYATADCAQRKQILINEGISFAVFGTLEKKKYPALDGKGFQCLKLEHEQGDYAIYSAG